MFMWLMTATNEHLTPLVKKKTHYSVIEMFQIMGHNITIIVDHLKNFDMAKNVDKLAPYEFNESSTY